MFSIMLIAIPMINRLRAVIAPLVSTFFIWVFIAPARDASLYNARPLLRDLHHAHTADVHRRIRSVRLCVLLHV